ncbi:MAG TPA: hypothetical protein VIL01_12815 [Thermomicrobiales bacterium]
MNTERQHHPEPEPRRAAREQSTASAGADSPPRVAGEEEPMEAPYAEPAADDAEALDLTGTDRLFALIVVSVMALLVICIVFVLVASRRAPAGL